MLICYWRIIKYATHNYMEKKKKDIIYSSITQMEV